jgi:acetoin utilization protein AcuB
VVKQIFENAKFHHLLVVENGKLYGVISDRDLLKSVSPFIDTLQATAHDKFTLNKKVHQIMSRKPITLTNAADVYEAIRLFNKHNISCIPIVNEKGTPIGIVSWRDILRAIEANHNKKLNNAK